MVNEIDDFKVILGDNFLVLVCVGVLLHLGGVMVMCRGNACFVHEYSKPVRVGDLKTNEGKLVVLQLAVSSEEESSTHLVAIVWK